MRGRVVALLVAGREILAGLREERDKRDVRCIIVRSEREVCGLTRSQTLRKSC